jgi:TRAP-type C4-dicarboxylate transport system permease small subunit
VTSDPGPPHPDQHGASRPGAPRFSAFGGVTQALNIVGTLLILAMAVAVNVDIIGRDFFNYPVSGVLEFVALSIVAIVFLQMANTLREERHVSNDILMRLVSQSRPRLAAAFYALFHLVGAMLMLLIVWFVWPILSDNYKGDYYRGTAGVIEIPVWPFMVAVIIGAAASAIQFLLLTWRECKRAAGAGPAYR